jgi:putative polyhydroxyalkanoate system protein
MADLELTRSHSLGLDDGRDAVERVAQELAADIGVDYEWNGDTLLFDGQGAEGRIEVAPEVVEISITLSAFLRPMKGQLKQEAERYLDDFFPS